MHASTHTLLRTRRPRSHATKAAVEVRPRLRPTLVNEMSRKRGALNLISVGCGVGSLWGSRQKGRERWYARHA